MLELPDEHGVLGLQLRDVSERRDFGTRRPTA
jgi:hypothetical protein